jgi:putative chitinase
MKRIAPEWYRILVACNVKPMTAAIWSEIFAACVSEATFSAGDEDLRNFLGQALHESAMLEKLEEGLSYSAERLTKVWPRRFPSIAAARPYEHNPEALANKVYGGRLGNTAPGDGWRYRGRGVMQVTGKDNYALVQRVTALPVLGNPDLLAQPLPALQAAIAWWERGVPDSVLHDPEQVTEAVNGGRNGLEHRIALTNLTTRVLSHNP